jgi:hypothetical protein
MLSTLERILCCAVNDLRFFSFPFSLCFLSLTHIHMYHPTIYGYHTPYYYALSYRSFCGVQQTFSGSFVWILLRSDDCVNRYAAGTALYRLSLSTPFSITFFLYGVSALLLTLLFRVHIILTTPTLYCSFCIFPIMWFQSFSSSHRLFLLCLIFFLCFSLRLSRPFSSLLIPPSLTTVVPAVPVLCLSYNGRT